MSAIERWQPNEEEYSTDNKDYIRRDRSNTRGTLWTWNEKDEQRREDRAAGTSQQQLALKTYGHVLSTSFRIDEQNFNEQKRSGVLLSESG